MHFRSPSSIVRCRRPTKAIPITFAVSSFPFSHIQTGFSHFLSLIKIMIVKTFQTLYFQNPLVKSSCLQFFASHESSSCYSGFLLCTDPILCDYVEDWADCVTQKTVCKSHWIQWLIFSTVHSHLCVQEGCSLHVLGQWAHLEENWTWKMMPSGSLMKSLTHASPTRCPVLFIRSTGNFIIF